MHVRVASVLVLLALVLGLFASPALAQAPVRVIFVGDSHSWFFDTYFSRLAASGAPAVSVAPTAAVIGNSTLEELWNLRPKLNTLRGAEGQWDFGVIGMRYWCTGPDLKEFTDWAPKFSALFKQAGAQTVLTVPWMDELDTRTIQECAAVADELASQLGARVAPVGQAVERVRRERPGLIEYVDQYHVNAPGWYLAMCVLYATLFNRSPEGLAYRLDDVPVPSPEGSLWNLPKGWALPDADAAYLQRVAWETVQEHPAKK
jgi:hypothetical protein